MSLYTVKGAYATPRTQKAKGVESLLNQIGHIPAVIALIQEDKDCSISSSHFPLFARPCPSEPKHGYIDSRVVKTIKEVKDLWEQVKADDPLGEILLMKLITATYNLVLTPELLVIGTGHDGATGGKDTLSVPIVRQKNSVQKSATKAAGVDISVNDPYVEIVVAELSNKNITSWFTQLRAGPKVETGRGNYIPSKMIIAEVLRADPAEFKDREWEKKIEEIKDLPGLVVWHPGGALTDHFSIHARSYKIPVVYDSEAPSVGEMLVPCVVERLPDPQAVLRGIAIGGNLPLNQCTEGNSYSGPGGNVPSAIAALLTSLHHSLSMTGDAGEYIGVGIGLLMRLGSIALLGESRHLTGPGPKPKGARHQVYAKTYPRSLHRHRAMLPWLINVFRYGDFGGGGGVGGPKWAACGKSLIPLFEGTRQLALNPTDENVQALIRAMNVAVNQAHNGGWWLNKFAPHELFDQVQQGNWLALSQAGVIYHQAREWSRAHDEKIKQELATFKKWPKTRLRLPRITGANLTAREGIQALQFTLRTPFLKGSLKDINIGADGLTSLIQLSGINLYLTDTDDGRLQVEARSAQASQVIWQEPSLDDIILKALKGEEDEEEEEESKDNDEDDIPF